jgi:polyisoprenoid-binding protein YceI
MWTLNAVLFFNFADTFFTFINYKNLHFQQTLIMKKTLLSLAIVVAAFGAFAQKKTTTSATVKFDAATPADALPVAENKTVIAAIDVKTGSVMFEAPIKGFNFSNPMMQDHFNGPKWMDSEKNPNAVFKGKITNLAAVNFTKDGTYKVKVAGDLSMHGVTKPVATDATIVVSGSTLNATATFTIKLADYALSNAGGKLADEPKIEVSAELK